MGVFVMPPPPVAAVPVAGTHQWFAVRRVWCVGRNYVAHAAEMGADTRAPPFFFSKPADAVHLEDGTLPYPPLTQQLHHEVELVVALQGGGRSIPQADALNCVYGYGVGLDMTRRDLQRQAMAEGRPWEIGKAFDGAAPTGALHPVSKVGHVTDARIHVSVNGHVRQDANVAEMTWKVPEIIHRLSQQVALGAGDLIFTGTPPGVGAVVPKDVLVAEIEGLGALTVVVGPPA